MVFGPFEYDEGSGDLRKYGIPIRLQGKPLQILGLLVTRSGEIITRVELQSHLWEGTTFVDFEHGLNSAVNRLRQTLGDSADQPRYVETLPGRGYRFIAPIQRSSTKTVLEMAAPAPLKNRAEARPAGALRRLPFVAGAALAILAGGYWLAGRPKELVEQPKLTKLAVMPPEGVAFEGAASRQSFALSTDGSRLAFTAMDSSGEFSVFLRDFNSLEPRLVPDSEGAHTVFWPPDSQSLYLTAKGKFLEDATRGWQGPMSFWPTPRRSSFSGAWQSSDSKRILPDGFRTSYSVPASGGSLEPLKGKYWWPQMLPDGEHLLYVDWKAAAGRYQARVVRLSDFSATKGSDRT